MRIWHFGLQISSGLKIGEPVFRDRGGGASAPNYTSIAEARQRPRAQLF